MRSSWKNAALVSLAAVLLFVAAACGSSSVTAPTPIPSPSPGGGGADVTISITNFTFAPASVTVRVGQKVAWQNGDSVAHTASANGGAFDTGTIAPGGTSAAITMSTAGTFPYHCAIHPNMVATLTVTQ